MRGGHRGRQCLLAASQQLRSSANTPPGAAVESLFGAAVSRALSSASLSSSAQLALRVASTEARAVGTQPGLQQSQAAGRQAYAGLCSSFFSAAAQAASPAVSPAYGTHVAHGSLARRLAGVLAPARQLSGTAWRSQGAGMRQLRTLQQAPAISHAQASLLQQAMRHSSSAAQPAGRRASTAAMRQGKSGEQGLYIIAFVVAMVGVTYASVPLYRRAKWLKAPLWSHQYQGADTSPCAGCSARQQGMVALCSRASQSRPSSSSRRGTLYSSYCAACRPTLGVHTDHRTLLSMHLSG